MTFHFADELGKAVQTKGAPLAIGLDPHLHQLPLFLRSKYSNLSGRSYLLEASKAVLIWVKSIIVKLLIK